ncbi:MAG: MJ0042-type zinc finger domain-containing protein [Parvibaculales bacterium]
MKATIMETSCPICHTKYEIPKKQMVRKNIAVRCVRCAAEWSLEPLEAEIIERPVVESPAVAEPPPVKKEIPSIIDEGVADEVAEEKAKEGEGEISDEGEKEKPTKPKPTGRVKNLAGLHYPSFRRKSSLLARVFLGLVLFIAVSGWAAVEWRGEVLGFQPKLAMVYGLFGGDEKGFLLEGVGFTKRGGTFSLYGEVRNPALFQKAAPEIELVFVNGAGGIIEAVSLPSLPESIKARGAHRFSLSDILPSAAAGYYLRVVY